MTSYQLLICLLNEHCVAEGSDSGTTVTIKPNKEVPSNSLQNPSDPDAGYSGHKGKGYRMQVMETYSPDKSQSDLITHVNVEAADDFLPRNFWPIPCTVVMRTWKKPGSVG